MPSRKIRLKACAFINNHLCQSGDIVEIDAMDRGPHTTKRLAHDKIDYGQNPPIDANRVLGEIEDIPLFEEVGD